MHKKLLLFFFSLMLLFPTALVPIRGGLLLLLLLSSLPVAGKRFYVCNEPQRMWFMTWIVALFSLVIGVINSNPGAFSTWTVYLAWPILYYYFAGCCNSIELIKRIIALIVNLGVWIVAFNIVLLCNSVLFHISLLDQFAEYFNYEFNVADTFIEYNSPTQCLMAYLLYFATILLQLTPSFINVSKKKLVVLIVLCLIAILLSRSRAMWVLVLALPIFSIIFLAVYDKNNRKKFGKIGKLLILLIFGVAVLFLGIYVLFDVEDLYTELLSSFDFSENESNYERTLQAKSLFDDFLNHPLIGRGTGYVSSYIRTPHKPWEYEMTYNYMLGESGLIGFSVYLFATIWIFFKSRRLIIKYPKMINIFLPLLAGLFVMLIMNETNPYMNKFDFLWVIFLPVIVINTLMKKKRDPIV